jgi:dihydrofolate reductase
LIEVVLIAAVAENGVIGRDNTMPWRLKSDLQRFRTLTVGKPIVMGRRTYQSLGRPLPQRTNIVVSRDRLFSAAGVIVANTVENALQVGRGEALRRGVHKVMVVGGSHIYAALMPLATELHITHVHLAPEGDTFFPAIDPDVWHEVERGEPAPGCADSARFTWITYRRAAPCSRKT